MLFFSLESRKYYVFGEKISSDLSSCSDTLPAPACFLESFAGPYNAIFCPKKHAATRHGIRPTRGWPRTVCTDSVTLRIRNLAELLLQRIHCCVWLWLLTDWAGGGAGGPGGTCLLHYFSVSSILPSSSRVPTLRFSGAPLVFSGFRFAPWRHFMIRFLLCPPCSALCL